MTTLKVKPRNLTYYLSKKRGLQRDLADALGICTTNIGQWKRGERTVPVEHIPTICAVLKCTEDDLCNRYIPKSGEDSPIIEAILQQVKGLTPAQQGEAFSLLSEHFEKRENS